MEFYQLVFSLKNMNCDEISVIAKSGSLPRKLFIKKSIVFPTGSPVASVIRGLKGFVIFKESVVERHMRNYENNKIQMRFTTEDFANALL
jgi:hypothetical protein